MLRLSLSLPPSNTILNLSIHGKNHAKILGKGGRLPLEVIKCCKLQPVTQITLGNGCGDLT